MNALEHRRIHLSHVFHAIDHEEVETKIKRKKSYHKKLKRKLNDALLLSSDTWIRRRMKSLLVRPRALRRRQLVHNSLKRLDMQTDALQAHKHFQLQH